MSASALSRPEAAAGFVELRDAGFAAYAEFFAFVSDPERLARFTEAQGGRGVQEELGVIRGLPDPHPALPLKILASVGHEALTGVLEFHYRLDPSSQGRRTDADAFRDWANASRPAVQLLCPEAFSGAPLWPWFEPPGGTVPAAAIVWSDVVVSVDAFSASAALPARGGIVAAYCLVRDWVDALQPLFERLGLRADEVLGALAAAMDDGVDGSSRTDLHAQVQRLISAPPVGIEGAQGVFLAMTVGGLFEQVPSVFPSPIAVAQAITLLADPDIPDSATLPIAESMLESYRVDPPAEPAPPPSSPPARRPSTAIASDLWTDQDQLGYRPYAEALAAFIQDKRTRTPLTIGIKAPWGAGKTSLMRMVKAELEASEPKAVSGTDVERLTNKDVLRLASEPPEKAEREVGVGEAVARRHTIVWFNAWKYQSGDQLWAGLAHAIVSQVTADLSPVERERFWARLNLRRIDANALRQGIHRAFLQRLSTYALIAPAVVLATAAGALQSALAGTAIAAAGIAGAGGDIARRWRSFAKQDAVTAVPQLVRDPGYTGQLGFLHLVHEDLERILAMVTTPEHPLVVFVDDLDRCSYSTVAQVIEALNVFLSGDFRNCVFVIGMEPDLVSAQIHVAYEKLFARIAERDGPAVGGDLGWRFLEKMVQLPLALPPPEDVAVDDLVDALVSPAARTAVRDLPDDDPQLARVREGLQRRRAASVPAGVMPTLDGLSDVVAQTVQNAPELDAALVQRVAREVYQEEFDDAQPEVRAVISEFLPHLHRNPREVKRFVNVFRFYAYILFWRETAGQAAPGLAGAGKLAALAIRAPEVLSALGLPVSVDGGAPRPLLAQLEDAADDAGAWQHVLDALGDEQRALPTLAPNGSLRALIAAGPKVGDLAGGFL